MKSFESLTLAVHILPSRKLAQKLKGPVLSHLESHYKGLLKDIKKASKEHKMRKAEQYLKEAIEYQELVGEDILEGELDVEEIEEKSLEHIRKIIGDMVKLVNQNPHFDPPTLKGSLRKALEFFAKKLEELITVVGHEATAIEELIKEKPVDASEAVQDVLRKEWDERIQGLLAKLEWRTETEITAVQGTTKDIQEVIKDLDGLLEKSRSKEPITLEDFEAFTESLTHYRYHLAEEFLSAYNIFLAFVRIEKYLQETSYMFEEIFSELKADGFPEGTLVTMRDLETRFIHNLQAEEHHVYEKAMECLEKDTKHRQRSSR